LGLNTLIEQAGLMVEEQVTAPDVPAPVAEKIIRETWPGVTDVPGVARLAKQLMRYIVLAPLAWILLAPCYFKKVSPYLAKRYTLTNRRLMIRRGLKPQSRQEVLLADIQDVQVQTNSFDDFYRTATLNMVSQGQVILSLPAVPEPETFRRSILNSRDAWVSKAVSASEF
jgi:hypothetical protein